MLLQREYIKEIRLYLADERYCVDGNTYLDIVIDSDAKLVRNAMSFDNSLTLKWATTDKIDIRKGSYVIYDGCKYTYLDDEDFEQKGDREYHYKLILRDSIAIAKYTLLKNTSDNRLVFEYTGTVEQHLAIVVDSLNNSQRDGRVWSLDPTMTLNNSDELMIPYSYSYCSDAIQTITTQFDVELYIVESGNNIIFKLFHLEPIVYPVFKYGKKYGLRPGVKYTSSSPKPTKMYVVGGDRNIDLSKYSYETLQLPSMYYGRYFYDGKYHYNLINEYDAKENFVREVLYRWNDSLKKNEEYESSEVSGGIDVSKLTEYIRPISSNYVMRAEDTLRPSEIDIEEYADGSHIYPSYICTVTSVETEEGRVSSDDGTNSPALFFNIADSNIPEDLDYSQCGIEGEIATIIFQSGMLAGREFQISTDENGKIEYEHNRRTFKLVTELIDGIHMPSWEENENGDLVPGKFVPVVGDKFIVYGISLPHGYIDGGISMTGASWDLWRYSVETLHNKWEEVSDAKAELDKIYLKENWSSLYNKIELGKHICIDDSNVVYTITSITESLADPYNIVLTLKNGKVRNSDYVRRQVRNRLDAAKGLLELKNKVDNQRFKLIDNFDRKAIELNEKIDLKAPATDLESLRKKFDSMFEIDEDNNAIKAKRSLYSEGAISAKGVGSGSGSGGDSSYSRLDSWADYNADKTTYVLSALLGNDLNTRLKTVETAGYATEIWVTGKLSGYALTSQIPTNNNQLTNGAGYITGIDSSMVTRALGYTPLSTTGTAANSNQLGGRTADQYMVSRFSPSHKDINQTLDVGIYRFDTLNNPPKLADGTVVGTNYGNLMVIRGGGQDTLTQIYFNWDNQATYIRSGNTSNTSNGLANRSWNEIAYRSHIPTTAAQIGALGATDTAVNSAKLGGQLPAFYATAASVQTLGGRVSINEQNISTNSGNIETLNTNISNLKDKLDSMFEIDSNGYIKAKRSLYSEGAISAKGIGSGSSGGGGGASYSRLDSWADYNADKATYVLSALLGNDLNTRLTNLETAGYITAEALLPYAKTSDLSEYAKRTEIPSLNGYATQDWVNDTLNDYALAGDIPSLTGYATEVWVNNQLTNKIPTNNNQLSNGAGYIKGIDSAMVIEALNYTPFNAADFTKPNIKNTLGIADWALGSAKPTYSWSEVQSRPTALSQFSNDVGYITASAKVSSAYSADESNKLLAQYLAKSDANTLGIGAVFGWVNTATGASNIPTAGNLISFEDNSRCATQFLSKYDGTATYTRIKKQSDKTWSDWVQLAYKSHIPTRLSQLTDDMVAGNYLANTGGTLSGKLTISSAGGNNQLTINNTAGGEVYMYLLSGGVNSGALTSAHPSYGTCLFNQASYQYLGISDAGVAHLTGQPLLHSGNFHNYAVPLTGGAMSGALSVPSITIGGITISVGTDGALQINGNMYATGSITAKK